MCAMVYTDLYTNCNTGLELQHRAQPFIDRALLAWRQRTRTFCQESSGRGSESWETFTTESRERPAERAGNQNIPRGVGEFHVCW